VLVVDKLSLLIKNIANKYQIDIYKPLSKLFPLTFLPPSLETVAENTQQQVSDRKETDKFTRGDFAKIFSNYKSSSRLFAITKEIDMENLEKITRGPSSEVVTSEEVKAALKNSARLSLFENPFAKPKDDTDRFIIDVSKRLYKR
jgi:hypothetical protein